MKNPTITGQRSNDLSLDMIAAKHNAKYYLVMRANNTKGSTTIDVMDNVDKVYFINKDELEFVQDEIRRTGKGHMAAVVAPVSSYHEGASLLVAFVEMRNGDIEVVLTAKEI